MNSKEFRAELVKIMPNYEWTVHQTKITGLLEATGTQSAGFNRLSTLGVIRRENAKGTSYEVKSSGYGLRARWLRTENNATLARALRGLQNQYEVTAQTYQGHADALKLGRGLKDKQLNAAPLKREPRYVVFKVSDCKDALSATQRDILDALLIKVTAHRQQAGKTALDGVFVEHDWPEFEPTWKAIEKRVAA